MVSYAKLRKLLAVLLSATVLAVQPINSAQVVAQMGEAEEILLLNEEIIKELEMEEQTESSLESSELNESDYEEVNSIAPEQSETLDDLSVEGDTDNVEDKTLESPQESQVDLKVEGSDIATGNISIPGGQTGASWRIDSGGNLFVDSGLIHSSGRSPWHFYRNDIKTITFLGPMTVAENRLSSLFRALENVVSIEGLAYLDTSNVTNMNYMFAYTGSLTTLDVSSFDTSKVTSMSLMFWRAKSITALDLSNFDTSNVTRMIRMFSRMHSLTTLDVSSFDTSNVTNMGGMFSLTDSLTALDVSNFDTSKVTNMSSMFIGAESLTALDVSNFDTSNVRYMGFMFAHMRSLRTLDVSSFNTSKVRYMDGMFSSMESLSALDLSSFDTKNVVNMSSMFARTKSLVTLDLSSFDTKNVVNMGYMFVNMDSLTTLDVSSFNTRKVTDMVYMFYNSNSLRILSLGTNFKFLENARLPKISSGEGYTGYWQNVGTGTIANPKGSFVLTSAKLMKTFDGATMADTFVWQPIDSTKSPKPSPKDSIKPNTPETGEASSSSLAMLITGLFAALALGITRKKRTSM